MNHNRRYYAGLLESWGLRKARPSTPGGLSIRLTWWRSGSRGPSGWRARGRITIRPFRTDDFAPRWPLPDGLQRRHEGPVGLRQAHRGRVPVFGQAAGATGHRRTSVAGRGEGPVVGFSITLPDINEAIRPLEWPADPLWSAAGAAAASCDANGTSRPREWSCSTCSKEYRRRGIAELLILRTLDYGKNVIGYTGAELGGRRKTTSRQPHHRGRRRPPLQDLPGLRERRLTSRQPAVSLGKCKGLCRFCAG